jgi:hypothetical protein
MTIQFDHQLLSSFALFLDNQIQSKGAAFTNYSGRLYPTASPITGVYAYSSPFRGLCYDDSVSGANVMTGVYLNGTFVGVGTSGLSRINHELGTVYFTGALPTNTVVSGRYALKQFNISITDEPDYKLLFETKYMVNSKFNQTLTGLAPDVKLAPAIYLKPKNFENKPFAFGRIDDNTIDMRAIIIADNQFNRIGVCNILRNLNMTTFPLITSTPLNVLGEYTGATFNYTGLPQNPIYNPIIWESRVIETPKIPETEQITRNTAIVDFSIRTIMTHP